MRTEAGAALRCLLGKTHSSTRVTDSELDSLPLHAKKVELLDLQGIIDAIPELQSKLRIIRLAQDLFNTPLPESKSKKILPHSSQTY